MKKLTTTTLSVALAASLTLWGINPALADEVATETTQESSAVEATATETKAVTTVKVPFTNADCVDKPSSDIVKTLEDAVLPTFTKCKFAICQITKLTK